MGSILNEVSRGYAEKAIKLAASALTAAAPSRENWSFLTRFRIRSKRSVAHFRSRCLFPFARCRLSFSSIFAKRTERNARGIGVFVRFRELSSFRATQPRGSCTFPRKLACSHAISLALDRLYKNATVTRKYGSALSWI